MSGYQEKSGGGCRSYKRVWEDVERQHGRNKAASGIRVKDTDRQWQ